MPRDVIETMLEAARWAPNHRQTEPWRFFVLEKDGETRRQVAQLIADWTFENVKNPTPERRIQSAEQARTEILESPAFMYVYAVPGPNEEVTRENYAATCCAVQNMSLAAHALGVAVGWSTGKPVKPENLAEMLGADPSWDVVGALYIGYPSQEPSAHRKPVEDVTTWL